MRRARSNTQKENRRNHILESALDLWHTTPYQDITMQRIAQTSELAKGTLYLYFQSKEELFLDILQSKLQTWFEEMKGGFAQIHTPEQASLLLVQTLQDQQDMLRLLGMLSGVLEVGVSVEVGVAFKSWLNTELAALGALLEQALPIENGVQVLLHLYATTMGLYQTANIPGPLLEAMQTQPELACLLLDFQQELQKASLALLRGHLKTGPA